MSTLNGLGTRFYGFIGPDEHGISTATNWFTVLYLPVIPLGRVEMIREVTWPAEFKYRIIAKHPLKINEILKTYFFGWIVTPLALFWPMPFAIREIAEKLGYTNSKAEGTFYNCVIAFSILNLIIVVWKWKDWDDKNGLPKNYKEILKARGK